MRHAFRTFASTPGVTAAAVLSLAIGIGANTALFSVANALLFRPLPYADADRLVILWNRSPGLGITQDWFSTAQYFDIRGTEVDIKVESGKLEHAFTARAQVKSDPAKPALAGDRDSTRQLLRLSIRITDKINDPKALEDGSTLYRERGVWVANFDQTKLGGVKQE